MDLDNREFSALYHAAWKKSVEEEAAALAAQRAQQEAEKQSKRGNRTLSNREKIAMLNNPAITASDLEELENELS